MLSILFIVLIFFVGYQIQCSFFSWHLRLIDSKSLAGGTIFIPKWMLALPASWFLGSIVMVWPTFFVSSYFGDIRKGAFIVLILGGLGAFYLESMTSTIRSLKSKVSFKSIFSFEFYISLIVVAVSSFISWYTFFVKDNVISIGATVWGDFGPHLALIESFSLGNNFPPQYPHYPDGTLRYHFMFQFFVAVLQALGMQIDWAFNLPSTLSLSGFMLLLYVLAITVSGSRLAGFFSILFFCFRSSLAFFTYVKEHIGDEQLWDSVWNVAVYIGKTPNESWGLWTLNVYANQRHFAFSLGVMVLVLLSLFSLLRGMSDKLDTANNGVITSAKIFLFEKDGWIPENISRAFSVGILLGSIGFWNGAVEISTLLILFVLAVFCRHRLEFLIVGVLAVVLSLLQQRFFIGSGHSVVSPSFNFGFLAEKKNLVGVLAYYFEMLGIFLPLFLISLFNTKIGIKAIAIAFISPILFATLVQLTTDINANHKFIMIGVMLSNIIIASFIARLFLSHDNSLRALGALSVLMLIITGLIDLKSLYNMNKGVITFSEEDPVTNWAAENSFGRDIFLTDWAVLHPILMAGRPIYIGWPYYGWSAGYDTETRYHDMQAIYGASNADDLLTLVKKNKIKFILIDDAVRSSIEYRVNEQLIGQTFPEVFRNDKDHTRIFEVN